MGAVLSGFAHREFTRPAALPDAARPIPAPAPVAISAAASARPAPVVSLGTVSASAPPAVATRVVKKGDTLLRLALDVYGFPVDEVFQRVREQNPAISNVNWILAGTEIRFPDVSDLKVQAPERPSHRRQEP
jgi:nucleoid-associated protein YgaU